MWKNNLAQFWSFPSLWANIPGREKGLAWKHLFQWSVEKPNSFTQRFSACHRITPSNKYVWVDRKNVLIAQAQRCHALEFCDGRRILNGFSINYWARCSVQNQYPVDCILLDWFFRLVGGSDREKQIKAGWKNKSATKRFFKYRGPIFGIPKFFPKSVLSNYDYPVERKQSLLEILFILERIVVSFGLLWLSHQPTQNGWY